jgi:hypothetical protein
MILGTIFCSCSENEIVEGKKDGAWTEYLDSTRKFEVSKDSSFYIRKINYDDGMPSEKFSDYHTKTNKLKYEGYLISGPYLSGPKRPEDRYNGVVKEFDEKTGKISDFELFDQYGDHDLKSYFVNGFDAIREDKRFDSLHYVDFNKESNKLESFQKFYHNPTAFMEEHEINIAKAYSNPDYIDFINFLSTKDKSLFSYFIMLDKFEFNGEIFKSFEDKKRQKSRIIQNKKVNLNVELYNCLWCRKQYSFNDGSGTCSPKCRAERADYQKSRQWER